MIGGRRNAADIIVGGEPRIDFLPVEVKARKEARRTRRFLTAVVVVVAMACAGGYLFATSLTVQSRLQLEEAQARTGELLQQQAEFTEVRSMTSKLDDARNARLVASATEILWADYLRELQRTLPSGAAVVGYTVDSQSALEAVLVPDVPLEVPKVATITLTVTVPELSHVQALLTNLSSLTGYAGATVTTVDLEDTDDGAFYTANVIMNVNSDAFAKRFFEVAEPTEATTDETTEEGAE